MSHMKHVASALGKAAKNTVKRQSPKPPDPQAVATYNAIKNLIDAHETWPQTETRVALDMQDQNGVQWKLYVSNDFGTLYAQLVCMGNGSNRRWESDKLKVGGLVSKGGDKVGFGMTVDFSKFSMWRSSVNYKRPETRPSLRKSA